MAAAKKTQKKAISRKKRGHGPALAIHRLKGDSHIVGIGNLRVIICEDAGIWFAQGLEIDYAANGNSLKDVQSNFEHGLAATIDLHLRANDTIKTLLVPAPAKVWQELAGGSRKYEYTQISAHKLEAPAFQELPYGGICYLEQQAA